MRWWPAPHWPTVRRRAGADRGLLVLAGAIIAVVTVLVGIAPPLLRASATQAVQTAVSNAGDDGEVRVHAAWERDDGLEGRIRAPHLADELENFRYKAGSGLDPGLRAVLRPPVAVATSPVLKVREGEAPRSFQLIYFLGADGAGPHVTWIAGAPPQSAVAEADGAVEAPYNGPPWPVQVGLSEADAEALHLRPGDRIPLEDERRNVKHVVVSGIFRADDSGDQVWRLAPWLLQPVPAAGGVGSIRLGGLLSRDSLPDARLAFEQDELPRTVIFTPEPTAFNQESAGALAGAVVTLKVTSGSSGDSERPQWESQLDLVLRDIRDQINAAFVQASVLLAAVLAVVVLVVLLAADLLIRRRALTLAAARQRGASLLDLGAELLVESAAVSLLAGAAGLMVARAIIAGVDISWAVPVVVAGSVAGPAFGIVAAARATNDRRVPANRSARRWARNTSRLRSAALAGAALGAAVIAMLALYQRGIRPDPAGEVAGSDAGLAAGVALPVSAPALGALAGALLLLRSLPAGVRLLLRWALRSRHPLAVFGAARAAATAARTLTLLALLSAAALASFALTLDATTRQGLVDGAWQTVGADARLDIDPVAAARPELIGQLTRRLAAAPDVGTAVAAQIELVSITIDGKIRPAGLVVVDSPALERLLGSTPLPDAPVLAGLVAPGRGPVPALVRWADGSPKSDRPLELLRDGGPPIPLTVIGTAPAIGSVPPTGDVPDTVIVDASTLTAAGRAVVPNTLWVTGPGVATVAAAIAGDTVGVSAVIRPAVEQARRTAPLTTGLLRLAWTSAAALLALGVLALALGAAAGAPERWQTLTRLRTLGLRPRDARWVAAAELLPPVLLAAVGGPLLGILVAGLTLGPLGLDLLTGQPGAPTLVPPGWGVGVIAVALLATIAVVVPIESALRRRQRLGEVLRAGGE